MTTLHLFNPAHDEALACHRPQYCPSLAARRLAHRWGRLPEWWAAEGDEVLVLPESMNAAEVAAPRWEVIGRIEPWGWDLQVVELLRRLGAPDRLLPSAEELEVVRRLSSRHTAVRLLDLLAARPLPAGVIRGESRWCTTLAEVEAAVAHFPSGAMLKAPWSSSGRGVFPSGARLNPTARARVERVLRTQGGIEVQRREERLLDAALEFVADGGVRYVGAALFVAAEGGGYLGQRVAPPQVLEGELVSAWQAVCPGSSLPPLVACLSDALTQVLGGRYAGPLGVDVLLTPRGLHPCIEINLRRTMGHAAIAMAQRLPGTALPAVFRLSAAGLELG